MKNEKDEDDDDGDDKAENKMPFQSISISYSTQNTYRWGILMLKKIQRVWRTMKGYSTNTEKIL